MQVPTGNALYTIAGGAAAHPESRAAQAGPENVRHARTEAAGGKPAAQLARQPDPVVNVTRTDAHYPAPRGSVLDIFV